MSGHNKPNINFKQINDTALASSEHVIVNWVPDGVRKGGEWVALNPTRNDGAKGSFSININTGVWKDFATNDGGSDLISLVAYVEKCSQGDAAKSLSKFLEIADNTINTSAPIQRQSKPANTANEFKPNFNPPASAQSKCPLEHPKNGKPSKYWDYLSTDGVLVMRVMRFDLNKAGHRKKDYRPLAFGSKGCGSQRWHWAQLPNNRPLYRLNCLNAINEIVICEGEKAADAAVALFPNSFVTCWAGGSKAITKTNFTLLKDKAITFWPDNDDAGQAAINGLKAELDKVGVKSFNVIGIGLFKDYKPAHNGTLESGGKWPDKADAFDAIELGWTQEHIKTALDKGLLFTNELPESKAGADSVPFGYNMDDRGIWYTDDKSNSKRLCSPIELIARSRSGLGDGRNWGILLRFKDFDGQEKLWNIPMQAFATDGGSEVIRGLLERGLDISSHRDAKRKILEYLQEYETSRRMSLVYKMGWHNKSFVLPDSVIGSDSNVMYYSERPAMCKLGINGTLELWKSNISKYCSGNPLALFAVSAALSAPLVELMGYESMGFHFFGDSSWGKSTLLNVACSVFGNPEKYKCTFRATDNALESLASSHSDMLLALDEINQVDSRIIGDIIYMLGNGQGKHRANERGQAGDSQHRWKLTYLTNGEKTLEQYLLEGGKKVTGGMEMRFIGIKATFNDSEADKKNKGIFNHCHEFAGGADLSNHLNRNMKNNHGTAFPEFIKMLVQQDFKELVAWLVKEVDKFVSTNLTAEAGGQVQRAAAKFALVGLSGELATKWGITDWSKGEAYAAAKECFNSWLNTRGGEGNMEDKQLFDHVKQQFDLYGESKFKRWDKSTKTMADNPSTIIDTHVPTPSEMWGYREHLDSKSPLDGDTQDVIYYVYPTAFEKVICKGNDHLRIARLLRDKGALVLRDSEFKENRLKTKERIPGSGKTMRQIYKIRGSALFNDNTEKSHD
ncbi:DUF927 domain-containing protein [Pseudoalteromonas sp. SG43-5]|uniref:DUF927 domain-containing protein n=1 Tax=Pseudoalteromonas sp. SG43-5 TaxID=2760968 RepID=UPI0015FFEF61|nr:DUF927 domain-containing protein [Pseudoalteromonas sp. SG43-5]MBB1455213.1 DUF927 domain-containing protein [Pseudoalteromonas sp. SG43-5]